MCLDFLSLSTQALIFSFVVLSSTGYLVCLPSTYAESVCLEDMRVLRSIFLSIMSLLQINSRARQSFNDSCCCCFVVSRF